MDKAIFIVGLGGTGGLLVPKLAKMINDQDNIVVWLMDGDTVDKSNVSRQPYQEFNVSEKKAVALSRKVKTNYNVKVFEYAEYLTGEEIKKISEEEGYIDVLIAGCVDNHSTRILLENQFENMGRVTYIDAANGEEDGSVFVAINKPRRGTLRSEVFPEIKNINDHPTGTCNQEILKGNIQQMVTNDIMANTLAMLINKWMTGDIQTGVVMINGLERVFASD
jgi:molybdopterin/thiamine biosynthesis adenylyltransferase